MTQSLNHHLKRCRVSLQIWKLVRIVLVQSMWREEKKHLIFVYSPWTNITMFATSQCIFSSMLWLIWAIFNHKFCFEFRTFLSDSNIAISRVENKFRSKKVDDGLIFIYWNDKKRLPVVEIVYLLLTGHSAWRILPEAETRPCCYARCYSSNGYATVHLQRSSKSKSSSLDIVGLWDGNEIDNMSYVVKATGEV